MRKIIIESFPKPVEESKVIIAERKGLGHPDTLIDALCNASSNALSRYYLKSFGAVLHHNIDKGLIIAGQSSPKFGGGKIIKPMEIYIVGRATSQVGSRKIDVEGIIKKEVKAYLKQFKHLTDYKLYIKVKEGAANLQEVFKKEKAVANDTSFGVAHAPLCKTEKLALKAGDFINKTLYKKIPAIGHDIKVMSVRYDGRLRLTLAVAFIDRYVHSMEEYIELKERVRKEVKKSIKIPCVIDINTLDDTSGDESTVYLTVTGLSAENGDDGQVGRGNRPSGLITPNRPMSLEATAGKNINHPGKLYQALAQIIANKIKKECYVKLLTQIGKPLDTPLVSISVVGKYDKNKITKAVNNILDNIPKIQKEIINDKYRLF